MFTSSRKLYPLRAATSAGLKGALPKVLLSAALLGGGGSVLFAGSAHAACGQNLSFAVWAAGTPLTCGDKKFTFSSSTPIPFGATGTVNSSQLVPGNYLFNVDFSPITSIPAFTLNYIAEVIDPSNVFDAVDLDSTVDAFDPPAEQLDATWRTGSFAGPVVATLQSLNGSSSAVAVAGSPTSLYVSNVYKSNGGAIDSFVNSYRQRTTTVPGPLPLLGVGMAYGFSRKLRGRIKARVQA